MREMKKLRIYLDTSVIRGCFDQEFEQWSNRLMSKFIAGEYVPVVSEIVNVELERAPSVVKEKYASLVMNSEIEMLSVDETAVQLAAEYIERGIVSANYLDDARHIALATVAGVDVLVSWNFKHIVRFDKIRMFNEVNRKMGYPEIYIYSPMEVAGDED